MLGKLVHLLVYLISLWPRGLSQWVGKQVGRWNYRANSRSAQVTRVNLELCFPEMAADVREKLVRESLENTGKTMMETPATWFGSVSRLQKWIGSSSGEEIVAETLAGGRGVLLLLPHIGNWELVNMYFTKYGRQAGLYHPPKQVFLHDMMSSVRSHFGHEMVPTTRRGITRLYKVLKEGGVVCVLPDQVPANGVFVPFFGVQAMTDQLTGRLLQKTGAVAVAVSISRRDDGRFHVAFTPADEGVYSTDPEVAARSVNSTVENCVLECPEQYQWEYKRFRERPAGEVKIYQFGKATEYHV